MILPQNPNGTVAPPANLPPQTPLQMGSPQAPQDRMGKFQQWSSMFNNPNSPIAPLVSAWMSKMQNEQNAQHPGAARVPPAAKFKHRAAGTPGEMNQQSVNLNRNMGF